MDYNFFTDRNEALAYLLDKYSVSNRGQITECVVPESVPASLQTENGEIAMFPWRVERRFIELKGILDQQILEDVSTLRFCNLDSSARSSLDRLIYQEFDLCEWLGGAPIARMFAVFSGEKAANIIVKLENGISCSVECSVMLSDDADVVDRHEIIARRGVASDRVVDTQLPQSSMTIYSDKEEQRFTDVDAEIFGLPDRDIHLVRSAFDILRNPGTAVDLNSRHQYLLELVEAAKQSEKTHTISIVKGGK